MIFFKRTQSYTKLLRNHYENYFSRRGIDKVLTKGPTDKLHKEFYVLEIPPNKVRNCWIYCTVGMSVDMDDNLIELVIYAPKQDNSLIELLTICASYHRNKLPLNLHHTVNIGRSWLDNSICDHAFISLPYLEGDKLEIFNVNGDTINCYWLIPITESERDYKIEFGPEALEQLFEKKQVDFLNPNRTCLLA